MVASVGDATTPKRVGVLGAAGPVGSVVKTFSQEQEFKMHAATIEQQNYNAGGKRGGGGGQVCIGAIGL